MHGPTEGELKKGIRFRTTWTGFWRRKGEVLERLEQGFGEDRERFLNDLDMILDRVGNGHKLCVERSEGIG